jgi:nicotinamidase/pyrazinamidase
MTKALLIVDLQNDFCPGGALPVKDGDKIVPVINSVIDLFSIVAASKDWHPLNTEHFEKWPVHCVRNSSGAEFHQNLKTDKIEKIFYKGTTAKDDGYSAFEATNYDLKKFLTDKHVNTLFICGLALDYCVKETALDSVGHGFQTYIISDATKAVAQTEENINYVINELSSRGIKFINSNEIKKDKN